LRISDGELKSLSKLMVGLSLWNEI